MRFDPILADIRFGCGLSPMIAPPQDVNAMMGRLRGPDNAAKAFHIDDFPAFAARMAEAATARKYLRKKRGTPEEKAAIKATKLLKKAARQAHRHWLWQAMMRRTHTADGLRERLAFFWADHFTARGKAGVLRRGTSPYIETAIRPYLTGSFAEMLKAVAVQPLMLHYLDQQLSVGPGSDTARRRPRKAGLNENLAREILELHTLGVDGVYDQTDVREFAELLTGMAYSAQGGFNFRHRMSEPGSETVLGVTYGGAGKARLSDVLAALDDLAHHPDTARHIAGKLAVHFVGDIPDPGLVSHLAARFTATAGDLGAVTEALLEHPAAWADENPGNVKQPVDFVGSAMRALAVAPDAINSGHERIVAATLQTPMALMGQQWQEPGGPDGWSEEDGDWITPQRYAARLDWAMSAPGILVQGLPDPRVFVETALGNRASEELRFAARGAEDRRVGVGLVLASPGFQRM
ncbi:MAG: hypothetical protein CSA70_04840 [Rhodobacterales bacterium]|nr:MAG: hypothetical protein CSA70_04840 [Rhodobacterales bacterium]